jgi:short-subunit dehydrogenase
MGKADIQGKWALVTGASSGLGVDFAKELASRGAHLILVARREEPMQELAKTLRAEHSVEVLVFSLDLAQDTAPQTLYDQIKKAGKTVDILVNNAGFGIFGEFHTIPWEREKEMLTLDILTLVALTKLFLKEMIERDYGYILQVASIGAYQPAPTYATYAAAKSFVLHFSEAVDYEIRRYKNVSCTALSPGITATEFLKVSGQKATFYQRMLMMDSPTVARIGIKSMLKRKPSVVSGWINAFLAWSIRFIPRRMTAMLGYFTMTVGQKK